MELSHFRKPTAAQLPKNFPAYYETRRGLKRTDILCQFLVLTWKPHIAKKRKQIDLTIQRLNWLIGRKSNLSIDNKLLIYKTITIPIWTYGLELWGCASKSNLTIIQRTQSKIIRMIANAPWYVSNDPLHKDLGLPYVHDIIRQRSHRHHNFNTTPTHY
jgi:hypothetical protein